MLVFVHGLGVSSRYFVPLMTELAGDYRCVAPDLPGHGATPGPARGLGIADLADALEAFLSEHDLPNVTFVANSLGCQVVALLAERQPARAAALVLVGPTLDPATRRWFWTTALRASVCEPLALLPILLWDDVRFGPWRFWTESRSALADDMEQRLPRLTTRALVVQGGHDHIVTEPWARRVASLLPGARYALVADGAHAVHYSRPGAVAALVRAFLASA